MEETVRKIEQLVMMFLPLIFMNQLSMSKVIIILIPIFISTYVPRIFNYFKTLKKSEKYRHYISYTDENGNEILVGCRWVKPVNAITIFLSTLIDTDLTKSYNDLYISIFEKDIEFKYNSICYKVNYQKYTDDRAKQSIQTIRLYSYNIEDIKSFEKDSISYIKKSFDKDNKKTNMYYEFDEKFLEKSINFTKKFSNTFISQHNYELITKCMTEYFTSKSKYEKYGIPYKIGFMFFGKPGNGKSSCIYAIAREYKRNIYFITPDKLCEIKKIVSGIPSGQLIVIEEIDDTIYSQSRTKKSDDNDGKSSEKHFGGYLSNILPVLDGYMSLPHDTILIITTNHPEMLDGALIRSGRIDHSIEFDNADHHQIKDIFKCYYDYDIDNFKEIPIKKWSCSHIINTIILPNINSPETALKMLREC